MRETTGEGPVQCGPEPGLETCSNPNHYKGPMSKFACCGLLERSSGRTV